MKKIFALLSLLLTLSFAAVAQQGLYSQPVPGLAVSVSQSPLPYGQFSWNLCPASLLTGGSTLASCQASPVAATFDQAGASAITQPGPIISPGIIRFYSPAGTYALVIYNNSSVSDLGNQIIPINVSVDPIGNAALNDGFFWVPPGSCAVNASANAGATNSTLVAVGASFTPAMEGSTSAAATQTLTCTVQVPTRLTTGKGITIQNVQLLYGVVTTAFTSTSGVAISTIAFPAPGTAETPSTITPVAIAGTLTVNPVVGSANLTAQTAGAFYTEQVTLGTPLVVTTDRQVILFQQAFGQTGASASKLDVPGLIVHYSINTI